MESQMIGAEQSLMSTVLCRQATQSNGQVLCSSECPPPDDILPWENVTLLTQFLATGLQPARRAGGLRRGCLTKHIHHTGLLCHKKMLVYTFDVGEKVFLFCNICLYIHTHMCVYIYTYIYIYIHIGKKFYTELSILTFWG